MSEPGSDWRTITLRREDGALHLTLARPEVRNAMNLRMAEEIRLAFEQVKGDRAVRAVVLRGAGGHFCAGGDLRDMAQGGDPATAAGALAHWEEFSRAFGRTIAQVDAAPQVVIALLEGAVLGGGFGLACAADVAIAEAGAIFGMPETTRGLPPAQIAPYVVRRVGLSHARRLALLGLRVGAEEAVQVGLVHGTVEGAAALEEAARAALAAVRRCAPGANAATKALLLAAAREAPDALLDRAARAFAEALVGPEGREGTRAFAEKRPPGWAAP
jgi:isohexenylglutaconyl-CoA hydratase